MLSHRKIHIIAGESTIKSDAIPEMSRLGDTLMHVGKKPAFYLGGCGTPARSITSLVTFINGFQCGQAHPDDSLEFGHFTRWVSAHYQVIDGAMDGFSLILEKMGGDDALAFDEFFRLWPLFLHDWEQIGPEGIEERYGQMMKEIRRRPRA